MFIEREARRDIILQNGFIFNRSTNKYNLPRAVSHCYQYGKTFFVQKLLKFVLYQFETFFYLPPYICSDYFTND